MGDFLLTGCLVGRFVCTRLPQFLQVQHFTQQQVFWGCTGVSVSVLTDEDYLG